jgi:hypothetical protein
MAAVIAVAGAPDRRDSVCCRTTRSCTETLITASSGRTGDEQRVAVIVPYELIGLRVDERWRP